MSFMSQTVDLYTILDLHFINTSFHHLNLKQLLMEGMSPALCQLSDISNPNRLDAHQIH